MESSQYTRHRAELAHPPGSCHHAHVVSDLSKGSGEPGGVSPMALSLIARPKDFPSRERKRPVLMLRKDELFQ